MGYAVQQEFASGGFSMIRGAVLGSPIDHSLSPVLHAAAYRHLGIDAHYEKFDVGAGSLMDFLGEHRSYTGFSLTMPLKEEAVLLASDIPEIDRRMNSINTLVARDGGWFGCSTDRLGIARLLKRAECSRIAIIGAGGTARSALAAIEEIDIGALTTVYARDVEKASLVARLSKLKNLQIASLLDLDISSATAVIQTTPVGVLDLYLNAGIPAPQGTLIEALYQPWPTRLATLFQSAGRVVLSGRDMLVEQAIYQVEIFSGLTVDHAAIREVMREALAGV